ncbi:alkene reductase [Algisphaera agarilytica]|uniref:N-ethylmaleimide reductase n=1 Tax=Algisphaera agarilytica TaxID=1385975 RepID=A0A7X0H6X6_9BACT|nr:alkene reductase [Algisphaera agarilytica]MBB6430369.1 N-ethylmaleimide reductase [Algisphaera agarilytica]
MASPSDPPLFSSYQLGPMTLKNRVVMAPMTRCRSTLPGEIPNALNATYYAQRSTAGLIISEATHINPGGLGYHAMPGIYSDAQRDGWKLVTDAVHEAGSLIFAQLFHAGRATVPELLPEGMGPVGPSPIPIPNGERHTPQGKKPMPTPHELTPEEIEQLVVDHRHAAEIAKAAGFDGVQLHGANGFIINDFLKDASNQRTDAYGGTLEKRMRFPMAVLDQLIDVFGPERVGIRLSPLGEHNGIRDSDILGHFTEIFQALDAKNLGHLEVLGAPWTGEKNDQVNAAARANFSNTLIFNHAYDAQRAHDELAANACDLISFGKPYIANPDLPERLRLGHPLNELADPYTLYNVDAGERGYTDYPTMDAANA